MAMSQTSDDPNQRPPVIGAAEEAGAGPRRRDFLNIAAVSFAGVGAVAVVIPLVNQMNPSADVLALAAIEVDISSIQPGQAIKTMWRKQPVFIRNLTPKEI
jgi:ubiquinol-cytochrome c reductase iron-sulfur subunit